MKIVDSIKISHLSNDGPSKIRLYNLLQLLDSHYIPKISTQVRIPQYCDKLIDKADVFIADVNKIDAGLLAIYLNNFNSKVAFITSIGVLPEFREHKIGQSLIELAINQTLNNGFTTLKLEVNIQNSRAIRFYQKNNFAITNGPSEEGMIQMILSV